MAKKLSYVQDDGTQKILTTARQEGTYLYFTGRGDDVANNIVGKGSILEINNTLGDKKAVSECRFIDDIFLKDGIAFWEGAVFGDYIDLEVVLPANTPMIAEDSNGNADIINSDGKISYITTSQTPDETWTGGYFLFPMDFAVNRFVNHFPLIGTNSDGMIFSNSDTSSISKDLKFRVTAYSPTGNTFLKIAAVFQIYRERTI